MIRFLSATKRLAPFVCLLGVLSLGCSKNQVTKPTPTPEEPVNAYKPNANARILAQSVIGDPASYSSIYDLGGGAAGQYCFRGGMDNRWGAGVLSASGSLVRLEGTVYSARGMCGLTTTSPAPNAFLVVGAHDSDSDPGSDVGYASLFSYSGTLLDQLLISSDTSDVWLSAVGRVTDSTFIAAGGERRHGTEYPYLALLAVTTEKRVALRARAVLTSHPTRWLFAGNVAVFPPSPGGNELFLGVLSSGQGQANRVEGIRATLPDLDPVSIEWSQEIVGQTGPGVSLRELVRAGDNLVVVGEVDDNRKQPAPSGGYWNSGLVASYTAAGVQRWQEVVSVSGHSDGFDDVWAGADGLYAVGWCASYVLVVEGQPKDRFCYGLVTKIDPNTGQVMENLSLGQDRYGAGFRAVFRVDGALTCVGWTEEEMSGGPYRAWFCRVGTSGTAPLASSDVGATPASARGSARTTPAARPRDRVESWR